MLPLSLLRTGQGHQIMVELKNGETYNGLLVNCDNWMNINLKNVIRTSKDSDKFWKIQSCYIRGNTIKYISVPDEIIDLVAEEEQTLRTTYQQRNDSNRGRGRGDGFAGRGRGDASGRGRGDNSYRGGRGGGGNNNNNSGGSGGDSSSAGRGRGEYRGSSRGGRGDFRGSSRGGRGGNNNSTA
ncbi:hypothetical protein ACTFIY_008442 [Dictyostelium cf. discoideum]